MTDKLYPTSLSSGTYSINALFPYQGQDNPSQGFRDNFRNTVYGLTSAYTAINSLIDNEINKTAGEETSMANAVMTDVTFKDWSQLRVQHHTTASATLNYSEGPIHTVTVNTSHNLTLALRQFPVDDTYAALRLYVTVPEAPSTITWSDNSYINNKSRIEGYDLATGVMSFAHTGTYGIEIASFTGDSFYLKDLDYRITQPSDYVSSGVTRIRTTATTNVILNNFRDLVSFSGYKGYALYKAEASRPCWVVIYTSDAARTADLATNRVQGDPPTTAGVIAEFVTSGNDQTEIFAPSVIGFNDDTIPNTDIPVSITNLSGGTNFITVTLTILKLES